MALLQAVAAVVAVASALSAHGASAGKETFLPTKDEIGPAGVFVNFAAPAARARAQQQQHSRTRRNGVETYSWGASKLYSTPFTDGRASTLGGKTLLVVRFKVLGAKCTGNCNTADVDTVISDADIKEITDYGNEFIRANSYGKAWLKGVAVMPASNLQIIIATLCSKWRQNLDLRCVFAPSTHWRWGQIRLESSTTNINPKCTVDFIGHGRYCRGQLLPDRRPGPGTGVRGGL